MRFFCRFSRLIAAVGVGLLIGCANAARNFPSLVDQGLLGLSATNPYLGPNIFLSGELERSTYLFNFFKNRGAPSAIELQQPELSGSRMYMYYPADREVYVADFREGNYRHEWVVRGPYTMKRNDYRDAARIQTTLAGDPVFVLFGKEYHFKKDWQKPNRAVLRAPVPEYMPAKPKPKVKKAVAKSEAAPSKSETKTPEPTPVPTPAASTAPLNMDQQALLISKGFAPRAENGDLLHIVRSDKENIEEIAKWYTGDQANAAELGKYNGMSEESALKPGARVKIPALIVKETRVMPAAQ